MKWQPFRWLRNKPVRRPITRRRLELEALESRLLFSVDVLTYRNDTSSSGENLNETQLTPASVSSGSFGQLFNTPLDGQVYGQPLVMTGVTIANGPNTVTGAAGTHDVVFVATENDSVYALDDNTGAILWHRSFLNANDPNDALTGATSVTAVPYQDATASQDIAPTFGITGTPVIDPNTNTMYLVTATKETVGGTAHYVQRLHGINIADGTDVVTPYQVGDTVGEDTYNLSVPVTNNTNIFVYGNGPTSIPDPYYNTGNSVVQFNALHENEHTALSLVNDTLYVTWSSHGGSHPYFGWVVSWNVSNLASNGFQLTGVLNTTPNTGLGGVWMGGGRLVFEPGSNTFYFSTGNGDGVAESLGANGDPSNDDYSDSIVKVVPDSTTSAQNQNPNGWGMKIADFFTPYDEQQRGVLNEDLGSGGLLLLPASAGSNLTGDPSLLVGGGKEGKLFLANRNDLGGFSPTSDNVLDAVPNGQGITTPPPLIHGLLSTPLYFNGTLYIVGGYNDVAKAFTINSDGTLSETSQTAESFGYEPGSPVLSADGTSNAILWLINRNTNELQAYDPNNLADELWDSGQDGPNSLESTSKMAEPTVANGVVYVGTANGLVAFGLAPTAGPSAPTLSASPLSGTSVQLTWQDPSERPNTAQYYTVQVSTDGVNYQTVSTAAPGSSSYTVGGLSPQTSYSFRLLGTNAAGSSTSNVVAVTTGGAGGSVNFANGFAGSNGALSYNGSAAVSGTNAELTDGGENEAGSVFTSQPVGVTSFQTSFTFQLTPGDVGDGFTFTIQGVSPTALGPSGGGLGYGPDTPGGGGGIAQSVAVKFDLYSNQGEGPDSTGLYLNGASPTEPGAIDLSGTGIDLHSGDVFRADLGYDGSTLTVTLTDTATGASATQTYSVNIPSVVGGGTAYVGFTGGTGGLTAQQDILTWTYSAAGTASGSAPPAPTGIRAAAASGHSINLTWGENSAAVTGFYLDRATDAGFTQNLITEVLPPGPNAFTDTAGLIPGVTYYYRLRAFNAAGASVNSAAASAFILPAPAAPTNLVVTRATSSEVDLRWTDNAGSTAVYQVYRSANGGPFVLQATLPGSGVGSTLTWKDTNVFPGTRYEYHVVASNITGTSAFADVTGSTTAPPPASPPPAAAAARAAASVNVFQSFGQLESNAFLWMLDNLFLLQGFHVPGLPAQMASLQAAINANPLNGTPLGAYAISTGYQLALSFLPKSK